MRVVAADHSKMRSPLSESRIASPESRSWAERDLAVLWHPCTQMHDHAPTSRPQLPLTPIARGDGAWLVAHDGRRYLDAISSWWTNLFGHANPRIGAAVKDQLDRLEQVIFAGFTHEPAILLAEELLRIAPGRSPSAPEAMDGREGPPGGSPRATQAMDGREGPPKAMDGRERPGALARVFYADNGSSAVEVALKMSFHYWRNAGQSRRTRFIALSGSYHGETLGALSVTDVPLYRATYAPLLGAPIFVASPDCYERAAGESWREHSLRRLGDMRTALERHGAEVCAVIVEPLVQCAGGMRMYDPAYLGGLRALCDEFGVHLIADEIAVGFGRTGTLFACEQANDGRGITPDFLCLSKGLTGGFLPLSAVLTTAPVYAAFYAEYTSGKAFLHSHSYSGNPLACRAALETLAIFRDEPVLERNRMLGARLAARLAPLAEHPHVAEVRQTGMIAAVELVRDKGGRTPFAAAERRGVRAYLHALERGVLLRPLGDVIYFMPPYVIAPEEIDLMVDVAADAITAAVA
jgi:adenosylmethionine-8-amino-7-oxononanoate aminotransferase